MTRLIGAILILFIVQGCASFRTKPGESERTFRPSEDFIKGWEDITPEEENVLGRAVAARLINQFPVLKDEAMEQYVKTIGTVIANSSDRPNTFAGYHFEILDTPEKNAFSAPGGLIFVTKGLLENLGDEDSLAAVLAHEVAHVSEKHGLKAIQKKHFAGYMEIGGQLVSALDCSGLSQQMSVAFEGAVADVLHVLLTSGYNQEQEREADTVALRTLARLGYREDALSTALQSMGKTSDGWFVSHPSTDERLRVLEGKNIAPRESDAGYAARSRRFSEALVRAMTR